MCLEMLNTHPFRLIFVQDPIRTPRHALLRQAPVPNIYVGMLATRGLILAIATISLVKFIVRASLDDWQSQIVSEYLHVVVLALLVLAMTLSTFTNVQWRIKKRLLFGFVMVLALASLSIVSLRLLSARDGCEAWAPYQSTCRVQYPLCVLEIVCAVLLPIESFLTYKTRKEEDKRAGDGQETV